jgi:hypothetical protein
MNGMGGNGRLFFMFVLYLFPLLRFAWLLCLGASLGGAAAHDSEASCAFIVVSARMRQRQTAVLLLAHGCPLFNSKQPKDRTFA